MELGLISRDMEFLCKPFAKEVGEGDVSYEAERLFHSLLQSDTFQLATVRQRNQFESFCKKLIQHHMYFILLNFVVGMMHKRDQYDLAKVYDLISGIQIRENYDLAQLCQDYAREVQTENEFLEPIPEDADLYHDYPQGLRLSSHSIAARTGLVRTLMKYVYPLDFADGKLTKAHIDAVVDFVRREATAKYEAECDDIRAKNAKRAEHCAEVHRPLYQVPIREFTNFERDRTIPGMLVPFVQVTELTREYDLCYYIQEQYALPALLEAPWEQSGEKSLPLLVESACVLAEYLQALTYREIPYIGLRESLCLADSGNGLYYEAICKGDISKYIYTGEKMQQYSLKHGLLFRMWAELLDRGGKRLKDAMHPGAYSFLMLHVPFVLLLNGEQERVSRFLLRHDRTLAVAERSNPFYIILLSRCILASTNADTANALYGIYSYELGKAERERKSVRKLSYEMLDFMQEAREYIRGANEYAFEENRSWFDILFGDGSRDAFLQQCRDRLDAKELLTAGEFHKLCENVHSFSHPTGVVLPWLGLPKYDNYDKLPGALSLQLTRKGQGFWEAMNGVKGYIVRLAQLETLRNIDLHLQNHLFKLQQAEMTVKLSRVSALKQALPQELSEQELENFLADIADIADDLAALGMGSALRPEAERKITVLRTNFETKYLQGSADLMQKLPKKVQSDVYNYLVTSMMVFDMMKDRDDDTLDYSAALISMTKALELIMLYVYTRLDLRPYDDMDADTRRYYFPDRPSRKPPALASCIGILEGSRFKAWGGDLVLDLSVLHKFSDIEVPIGIDEAGMLQKRKFSPSEQQCDTNRETLMLSLFYICEHYRNRSAHVNVVTLMQVKECQQLLIDGQKLLWVVLAALKEA